MRHIRKINGVIFLSILVLILSSCGPTYKNVTVLRQPNFNYKEIKNVTVLKINPTYQTQYQRFPFYIDGCKQLSDEITSKLDELLINNRTYGVIERQRIGPTIVEQDIGSSGRIDPETAAKIGKITGVDAIISGNFTCELRINAWGVDGSPLLDGADTTFGNANLRMTNTTTAKVLFTKNYRYEYFNSADIIARDFFYNIIPHEETVRQRVK